MVRRIAAVLTGLFLLFLTTTPTSAQRVEASVGAGYTLSEGVTLEDSVVGFAFDEANVESGGSFNASFGVFVDSNILIEFLYARQSSLLSADNTLGGQTDISELNVSNYHGNFVYHFGYADSKVRPFVFGGLGATNYSFGNLLVTGSNLGGIENDTQFSTTWGGGVKVNPTPNIGLKFMARWVPTYIKSTEEGYWCDPFYGCWVLGDPDYSHQLDFSGGVTFRF